MPILDSLALYIAIDRHHWNLECIRVYRYFTSTTVECIFAIINCLFVVLRLNLLFFNVF